MRLAVVIATEDESTAWYVRSIAQAAGRIGIACDTVTLGPDATRATAVAAGRVERGPGRARHHPADPAARRRVAAELAAAIAPEKDVDGANPLSLGRLAAGLPAFAPATAEAVVRLLEHHGVALAGRTSRWSAAPPWSASRSRTCCWTGTRR